MEKMRQYQSGKFRSLHVQYRRRGWGFVKQNCGPEFVQENTDMFYLITIKKKNLYGNR